MKKVSFLFSLGLCALVFSCNKEATTTAVSVSEKNAPLDRIGLNLSRSISGSPTTLALESGIEGGTADQSISRVESLLNDKYSYADQSIGSIFDQETTLQFAMTNGSLNATQVQVIYDAALNFWSQTYISYTQAGKIGLLLDLEKQATSTASNLVVKVRASVGTPQGLGTISPCDNVSFDNLTYNVPFCDDVSNTPSNVCAQYHLTKKINIKVTNNAPVAYFDDVKLLADPLAAASSDYRISNPLQFLSKSEIEAIYCKILAKIDIIKTTIPAGYQFASIKIEAKTLGGAWLFHKSIVIM